MRAGLPTSTLPKRHPLSWDRHPRQDAYLREHAGEQSPARLAREVSRLGPARSASAVRHQLVALGLAGVEPEEGKPRGRYTLGDLRTELTVDKVAYLTGQDSETVYAQLERRELRGHKADGAWRIWPVELRRWALANRDRLQRRAAVAEGWHELVGLLAGEWGVTDETQRRRARGRATEGQAGP